MRIEDAGDEVVREYERAIAALYAAVGTLAQMGVPLARVLVLAQAAYDRVGALEKAEADSLRARARVIP